MTGTVCTVHWYCCCPWHDNSLGGPCPWQEDQAERVLFKRPTFFLNAAVFIAEHSFWVLLTPLLSRCLIGWFLLMFLVIGQLNWLPEVPWTCLCLGFLLLNFSSCSFDAVPVTCISCHVCFWSRALPVHDCALANSHMIFVDIFHLFHWVDLR